MAGIITRIVTHPHTLTTAAGALTVGSVPTLGVGGWQLTDWLKLAGAVIGLVLSFLGGKASKK